jgi:hypothetical protein
METKLKVAYRPQKGGFPFKLLKYLYDNGTSAGVDIQQEIGINEWADSKGVIFYSRASSTFDMTVRNLEHRGLLVILENDTYELTKQGNSFVKSYSSRR